MHELSIASSVVEICAEQAHGARVRRVTLEIGRLSAVMPDAIRFCFDVCARDTAVEGATLEIVEMPGQARCLACGATLEVDVPFGQCGCGSDDLELISGQQLTIRQMEVV
ncbi:hydrogenase maturation nickel metallochaperone HypA [Paraburkholderia fungorum]|uniref:hydrogenase maturation nickel metallochaperone HypA n=1 Tax=Paraburkholderia fungorum TaxID=134537 RepID=UPI0038BE0192